MSEHDETVAETPEADAAAEPAAEPTAEPASEAAAPQPHPLAAKVAELEVSLAAAEAQKTEYLTKLRAVSKAFQELEGDMAAFRIRAGRDADQRSERKVQQVIEQFFEPVMNLRRSLAAANGADPAQIVAALPMVVQQFNDVLARLGLEEVPGVGAAFDPAIHEALAIAPVADPAQDGKVITVFSAGWRVGGKVLQAAQVVVGKHEAAAAEA